jgi:hypothetical protein
MAIKKVIEIDVDQVQAMGGLNALEKSLKNTEGKSASLKQQLRQAVNEAQMLADKFGASSKQAIEASKRAADLKDRIEDANDAIQAFKGEGTFLATSKALTAVSSGFTAVQGGMNLIGVESKDLEKQLLQVQSAMALSSGLAGLEDAGRAFTQLKTVAVNAFNSIKTAIGATGIGLLIVALGTIVTYWDDIKEAVGGVSEEQKKLNADSQKNLTQEQEKLKTIGDQDEILKLQGKSEREILKMKIAQTNEAIIASEINLENIKTTNKEQQKAVEQNYKYLKSFIDFISIPQRFLYENGAKAINALIGLINKIPGVNIDARLDENFANNASDYVTKLIFDPDEVKAEGEKTVKEAETTLMNLKNQRAGFQNSINAIDKKASDDRLKSEEEEYKKRQELQNQRGRSAEAQYDALLKIEADAREKNRVAGLTELEQTQQKYDAQIEQLRQAGISTVELEIEKANAINDINLKQQALEEEQRLKNKQLLDDALAYELNARQAFEDAKFNIASQGLDLLSGLFGKSKGIANGILILEKSLAIGQIISSASRSIAQATANLAAVPAVIGVAPNPMYAVQAAATAKGIAMTKISAGISIASILAQTIGKLSGGGSLGGASGGGASGGGAGSAPQFNLVGQSSTNQLTATIAGQQNQPIQTYVVGSQVTSQQALDRNAQQNSVFG